MAVKGSDNKDANFFKRVLSKSHQRLLEDLDPVSVLDQFIEAEYLPSVQIRDIQEMQKSSDKIREIVKQVSSKGVLGYKKFKQMLKKSGQKHLAEYLAEQEDALEKEISYGRIFESINHGRIVQAEARPQAENQRIPDDRELLSIAEHIGGNWEILGAFLGIEGTRIDHIKLDNPTTPMRIYRMLLEWRNMYGDEATVENLFSRMQSAPSYVNIDWIALKENSRLLETIDSQTPDTDGNVQRMPDEKEVTNDMQQLSLDQPSLYGGHGITHSQASKYQTPVLTSTVAVPLNSSIGSAEGAFGNTRRQGVYESNEYSPDLSGGSNFSRDVSDGQPERTTGQTQVRRRDVPGSDQLDAGLLRDTPGSAVLQRNVNFVPPDSIHSPDYINARNVRLEKIFKSEDDMKGRLKMLTAENIEDLLDSCGSQPMYRGGFGDIYVSERKIPGLRRRIVVKKIDLKEKEAEQRMRSLTSEKLCARSVHFAIVPLYGIREDSENKIFYFLSPYMEMGSLNQVIEDDNKSLERKERPVLHPGHRLRILFQIASAIDFLHTPLKDIRGIIIHGDIKSLNIVLDEDFNARLIDFGLAREMKEGHDHTKTTSKYVFTPGYGKETQQDILAKHDDYRYFGVVIRELLTGRKPSVEGCPEENLIDQVPKRIEKRLLGMWKKLEMKPPLSQSLVQLSTDCIKDKALSSKRIVKKLKELLKKTNTPRWQNLSEDYKICDMCLESDSVGEAILTHYNCKNNINVCVSCMRNSYCNPIHCHSCEKEADSVDTTIYPTIGHGWAALLIAGDDSRDSVANSLKADVDAVFKVITSKCPLVMGVSVENVQIVKDVENVKKKMEDVVKALQNVDDIQTLLVYISSHYVPEKGGFELKSKPEKQFLSLSDLQEIIANILHEGEKKRTIVLLDCCSSPAITIAQTPVQDGENNPTSIEPTAEVGDTNASETSNKRAYKIDQELILKVPGIRIVQMNACRPNQNAVIEPDGSLFRKILLQSLTRNALDEPCVNFPKCQFCSLSGDFVTVEKMQEHIASHWVSSEKCDCVSYYHNVDHVDVKIGYVINFKVDLQVTYRYKDKVEHDRIPQRMFGELSELLIVLFDKYVEKMGLDLPADNEQKLSTADFYDILCIEVEKGPKKHHRDRLSTLERVMAAWNAKRELVVTLRTLPEVTDGAVGIFLPSGQSVEPILDILQKEKSIKCLEEDYATAFVIKLTDEFKVFKISWDKVEQNMEQRSPTIETFDDHLLDLEEALDKTDMSEKKLLKELQIVFPCANINGKRKHRRDFMCYKVVRREDG